MCLVYLSDAQIDSLYSIDVEDVHFGNIFQSSEFHPMDIGPYSQFDYYTHGNKPYMLGPGRQPSVVVIGTSHCEMFGFLLKQLTPQYNITVAILCAPVDKGKFFHPLSLWDELRLSLLDLWKPKLIVWIDYWAMAEGAYAPFCGEFQDYDFKYAFNLLSNRTEKLLVLGDVPQLPITEFVTMDYFEAWVLEQYRTYGNSFDFLLSLKEEPSHKKCRVAVEANIRTALEATLEHRGRFVETASYFRDESTQFLQLIDPVEGSLVYHDYSHLRRAGAQRLEQLFRKEIFNQRIC